MVFKIPPPPDMGRDNQRLNRWLLEIQSILNSGGLIDPSQIDGLPAVIAQVGRNTTDIGTLDDDVSTLNGEVTTLNGEVAQNTTDIAALQTSVTTLQARNQVFNGSGAPIGTLGVAGDWYADTTGLHIYVKIDVVTWQVVV